MRLEEVYGFIRYVIDDCKSINSLIDKHISKSGMPAASHQLGGDYHQYLYNPSNFTTCNITFLYYLAKLQKIRKSNHVLVIYVNTYNNSTN